MLPYTAVPKTEIRKCILLHSHEVTRVAFPDVFSFVLMYVLDLLFINVYDYPHVKCTSQTNTCEYLSQIQNNQFAIL